MFYKTLHRASMYIPTFSHFQEGFHWFLLTYTDFGHAITSHIKLSTCKYDSTARIKISICLLGIRLWIGTSTFKWEGATISYLWLSRRWTFMKISFLPLILSVTILHQIIFVLSLFDPHHLEMKKKKKKDKTKSGKTKYCEHISILWKIT